MRPLLLGLARDLAEACLEVQRVNAARMLVIDRAVNDPEPQPAIFKYSTEYVGRMAKELKKLDRYGVRATSRREKALKRFLLARENSVERCNERSEMQTQIANKR